jgi:hypothetical protein
MIVDLREEEDTVADSALVTPTLEPGQPRVRPHLFAAAGLLAAGPPTVLLSQEGTRVLLHILT